jgi:hypothetical protein
VFQPRISATHQKKNCSKSKGHLSYDHLLFLAVKPYIVRAMRGVVHRRKPEDSVANGVSIWAQVKTIDCLLNTKNLIKIGWTCEEYVQSEIRKFFSYYILSD